MYNQHQDYQEKTTNILGLILLFAGTVTTGSILSVVYLTFNPVVLGWSIYLCALLAILFGVVAGTAAGFMVNIFQVTNFKQAMAVVILGCVVFSYFKWALYLQNDAKFNLENGAVYDFSVEFTDENGKQLDKNGIIEVINIMQNGAACDIGEFIYGKEWLGFMLEEFLTSEALDDFRTVSYFDFFGYSDYFGVIPEIAAQNIINYSNYTYMLYYIENDYRLPGMFYFMANPGEMLKVVEQINREGRWFIYNRFDNNVPDTPETQNTVTGPILLIVWIGEFLLICVPAIKVTYKKVKENDITGFTHINLNDVKNEMNNMYSQNTAPVPLNEPIQQTIQQPVQQPIQQPAAEVEYPQEYWQENEQYYEKYCDSEIDSDINDINDEYKL